MNFLDSLLAAFTVQDDGANVPPQKTINFQGFDVADDPANLRTNVAPVAVVNPPAVATIQNAGVALPQRSKLNFVGFTVADDPANLRTNVTRPGAEVIIKRQLSDAATNTINLTDIPDLQFTVAAGELWLVQWVLHVAISGASNNGVRIAPIWPAGMSFAEVHGVFMTVNLSTTAATPPVIEHARTQISGTELLYPNISASLLDGYLTVDGLFHSSTAAGLVKLRMAMASSVGGATSIDRFSFMRAMRA